nr:uncharacterized protein LOC109154282 [Ipomoea batatas]
MKSSKRAKTQVPRIGTSQCDGTSISPAPTYTGEPATIVMDPAPISQVPFQEIQESRASPAENSLSPGNPNNPLVEGEEMTDSVPIVGELGENLIVEKTDKISPIIEQIRVLNSSPSDTIEKDLHAFSNDERETKLQTETPEINFQPSLLNTEQITAPSVETVVPTPSGKMLRKRKRVDPVEGADPRAKRPNDFPISARPPRRESEEISDHVGPRTRGKTASRKPTTKEKGKRVVVEDSDVQDSPSCFPKPHTTNIEPYEENAIYEFYNNLGTGTTTPSDPMYGKINLRSNFYNFTPALINEYMGTSPREEEAEVTSEQVAQELTAGNNQKIFEQKGGETNSILTF